MLKVRSQICANLLIGLALLSTSAAHAEAPWPQPKDLDRLCAGWAGAWRTEADLTWDRVKGWVHATDKHDWSVEQVAAGQCRFRHAGKLDFVLDTTLGFYEVTFFESDKPGRVQRGKILFAELAGDRAWNIVVQAPGRAGTYRMQMTMAGDRFVIYLTEQGSDAARLEPHGLSIHRRQ